MAGLRRRTGGGVADTVHLRRRHAPAYHELEFIGYGDAAPLVVYSASAWRSGQRVPLSPPHLVLERFDPRTGAVALEFRNPGDASLPPSLALRGMAGRARLSVGASVLEGGLVCD